MEDGNVLEQGSIVDMFANPQKSLTKEFINTATHFDQEIGSVLAHPMIQNIDENGRLFALIALL